jgi:general secretion pathway protein G
MTDLYNHVKRRRHSGEGGFTLIELLVVIAILSVLAAIVIFNVTGVKSTSENAACNTDVQSVQTAVDQYLDTLQGGTGNFNFSGGQGVTSPAPILTIDPTVQSDLVPAFLNAAPTACSSASPPTQWGNIDVQSTDGSDIVVSGSYS